MDIIEVKKFSPKAHIPKKMTPGSAGFDLYALQDEEIQPRSSFFVRTGVNIYVPSGYYGAIKGRSGNAFLRKMFVFNDVISSGYQEEIAVLIMNFDDSSSLHVKVGERIAQIILTKIHSASQVKENVKSDNKDAASEIVSKTDTSKIPLTVSSEATVSANVDTQEISPDDDMSDNDI